MSKQMLELADLIESDQIDLDNIGTHNRNLIVSALRSSAESAPQPSSGHGCKRAGGFIDSGCTALCDCHITLALSRSQAVSAPQPPAGYQKLPSA